MVAQPYQCCNEPVVESLNHRLLPDTEVNCVCSDYSIRICDSFYRSSLKPFFNE